MKWLKEDYPFVGDWTYAGDKFTVHGKYDGLIKIGKFGSIGPNLNILTGGEHWIDFVSSYPFPAFEEWKHMTSTWEHEVPTTQKDLGVSIGNDVWIGINVTIKPGITIGDGAVIGMGAVVVKDVEPYAIVGGNPAKLIRYRFSPEIIEQLLKIKWWEWSDDQIRERLPDMDDVENFCRKYLP